MGTLGTYLADARVRKGLDLHDAAQRTRISIAYLRALEEEDFTKLPGEVFVRGFLKNYAKFLELREEAVLEMYRELNCSNSKTDPGGTEEPCEEPADRRKSFRLSPEPVLWSLAIGASLTLFLFLAQPDTPREASAPKAHDSSIITTDISSTLPLAQRDKLYLKLEALVDSWFLVRMDAGPQKKNILKKGENVVWAADERFLVSFANIESVKLYLNDQELFADIPENTVVRDLLITEAGIVLPKPAPVQRARPAQVQAPRIPAALIESRQTSSIRTADPPAAAAPAPIVSKPVPTVPPAPALVSD